MDKEAIERYWMPAVIAALGTVIAAVAAVFAAASLQDNGSDSRQEPFTVTATVVSVEKTVIIGGEAFTCAEIAGVHPFNCSNEAQFVFDEFGANFDLFVRSGELGAYFNDAPLEDASYAGIIACIFWIRGEDENDYTKFMTDQPDFENTNGDDLLPPWIAARRNLCPD